MHLLNSRLRTNPPLTNIQTDTLKPFLYTTEISKKVLLAAEEFQMLMHQNKPKSTQNKQCFEAYVKRDLSFF